MPNEEARERVRAYPEAHSRHAGNFTFRQYLRDSIDVGTIAEFGPDDEGGE